MSMTSEEREQVVELLRCAADSGLLNRWCPMSEAVRALDMDPDGHVVALADEVLQTLPLRADVEPSVMWRLFGVDCLEAAARVEEGSWP